MSATARSRRHRNAHTHEEQESSVPVFNKADHQAVQTKLTIGQPGDKYEQEADSVADAVVNNSNAAPAVQQKEISGIQRSTLMSPEEDEKLSTAEGRMEKDKMIQEKPELQMQQEEEEPVQMMGEEEEEPLQMQEEEEEPLQMMGEEEEEMMQTKSNTPNAASPALSAQLQSSKGGGRPLPGKTRSEMESSIGADFKGVNIHTGAEAVEMNKGLHAQAFTHGKDVYFNAGKYNPDTMAGKRLLAHELTHVVQQASGERIQKEAEVGPTGSYTNNYIFRPNAFFRRVKSRVADGMPITDDEITELREYAIERNGTVQHVELLLMAAMRRPANVTLMNTHSSGNLIISMNAIPQSDRDHVMNMGREGVGANIMGLKMMRFMARLGLSSQPVAHWDAEIDSAAHEQIIAAGGSAFQDQALKISTHLISGSTLRADDVLAAMHNAASDSTSGDKVMAGMAYITAREYGHSMADRLRSGSLKVDALIPRVYRRIAGGGDASYQYSTDGDVLKSDTLYLPTSLNLFDIMDRALIIHELTHAADDAAATSTTSMNSVDLEMNGYRAQARYIMDQIRPHPPADVPGLITSASELANRHITFYWAFISAAKSNTTTYSTVLTQILTAAPSSKTNTQITTDLARTSADIDAQLSAGILSMTGSGGGSLYSATSTTRVDGNVGHFFHP